MKLTQLHLYAKCAMPPIFIALDLHTWRASRALIVFHKPRRCNRVVNFPLCDAWRNRGEKQTWERETKRQGAMEAE